MTSVSEEERHLRVLALEKSLARRAGFWRGVVTGVATVIILVCISCAILYFNRETVAVWATNKFAVGYVEQLFAAFPEAYMTNNKERVLDTLDRFTNAVAANRVHKSDFETIGRHLFAALKDKRITYQEMEILMASIDNAAKSEE